MSKDKITDQLDVLESYLNDIPMIIDPCRMCGHARNYKDGFADYGEECRECCYYYDSKFEVKFEEEVE